MAAFWKLLFLVGGLVAAFAWGFATSSKRVFPYGILRSITPGTAAEEASIPELAELTGTRIKVKTRSRQFESLMAVPYVDSAYDPRHAEQNVLHHDEGKAFAGYNLYNSRLRSTAYLVDMYGAVVHEWSYATDPWQHIELLPDGDLLVMVKDHLLLRLDKDSRLRWALNGRFHHDLDVAPNGDIFSIAREVRRVPEIHEIADAIEDVIIVLSPEGEEKDRISVLELVRESPYAYLLPSVAHMKFDPDDVSEPALDMLHTNHVEVFDGRLAARSPLFARGNLLISLRILNAIAIVDGESRRIAWLWGPTNLTEQHHPTLLESGHLLIFNNGVDRSEVIELDPLTRRVVWKYAPGEEFFSHRRGSNQRLPNGNTLITESDKGYVIEVTRDGEVVWKFANPDVSDSGERAAIWRMTRFREEDLAFLDADR